MRPSGRGRRRRRPPPKFRPLISVDVGTVLGGAFGVLLGLIFLGVGLRINVLFFAAPVLIITGIAAIIKGLMNRD
jgi:hypothetical protein